MNDKPEECFKNTLRIACQMSSMLASIEVLKANQERAAVFNRISDDLAKLCNDVMRLNNQGETNAS